MLTLRHQTKIRHPGARVAYIRREDLSACTPAGALHGAGSSPRSSPQGARAAPQLPAVGLGVLMGWIQPPGT